MDEICLGFQYHILILPGGIIFRTRLDRDSYLEHVIYNFHGNIIDLRKQSKLSDVWNKYLSCFLCLLRRSIMATWIAIFPRCQSGKCQGRPMAWSILLYPCMRFYPTFLGRIWNWRKF